jgi:hypothetical protein
MLSDNISTSCQTLDDRETRVQALLQQLRSDSETVLRQMAERLVDLPENKSFGQIEYDLRDLAHQMATSAHQTGLQAGKKRGTSVPRWSAPTAKKMLASSNTAPGPC